MDSVPAPLANASPVVAWRRDLHRFPELGFLEYRTAAIVAERLAATGWEVRAGPEVMSAADMLGAPLAEAVLLAQERARAAGASEAWIARMPGGQTGVVAELRRGPGPVLALRFDMDALPVAETSEASHQPNAGGWRSGIAGQMHACGHDGHTAIGLALAERSGHPAAGWQGTLRLIFQPAEEGGRGAWPMVRAGIVDDVDWFFAGHLGCFLPSGEIAAEATGFLFSTKIDVTFHGRAAHAAMGPQEGRNAILAGAAATLGLYGISRHAQDSTLVNVGKIVAGAGRNIIADRCDMMIEVRGGTAAAIEYMEGRAQEVIAGAAAMHGCTFETTVVGKTSGIVQSAEAVALVSEVAGGVPGIARVHDGWSIGGGDDATFMMQRVQDRGGKAAYFLIGSTIPAVHHAVDFDIDETSLEHGVAVFAGIVDRVLGGRR